jgi:tetratricopeptide (TPR) repeat protein
LVSRKGNALLLVVVLALTACVYFRTLGFNFVGWDDDIHIYANPQLSGPLSSFWAGPYKALYIPLSYMALAALASLSHLIFPAFADSDVSTSLNPLVFHTANFALHLINTLLVLLILRRCCKNGLAAALGALFFSLHPLQVESVAWCSELRGLLSSFFSLIAILVYIRSFGAGETDDAKARFPIVRFLWIAFFTTLALLSKPSAAALPIALCALGWAYSGRSLKRVAGETLPLLLLVLPIFIITHSSQNVDPSELVPIFKRPFIAGDALAFYVFKTLIPIHLGVDYARYPSWALSHWWGYCTWILPAALFGVAWTLRYRSKIPLLSFFIFVGFLSPVLGFVPFLYQDGSTVADRYVYLALLGPAFLIAGLLVGLKKQSYHIAAFLIMIALGGLSFTQTRVWKNNDVFWDSCLAFNPNSGGCNNNKGLKLALSGRVKDALPYIEKSRRNRISLYNLGTIYYALGDYENSAKNFSELVKITPYDSGLRYSYSLVLEKQKRYDEASEQILAGLKLHPTRENEIDMLDALGDYFDEAGRYANSYFAYMSELRMSPEMDNVQVKAAGVAMKAHHFDVAFVIYRHLLQKYPTDRKLRNLFEEAKRLSGH